MIFGSFNQSQTGMGLHEALQTRFSAKDDSGPYMVFLEELGNKTKQFSKEGDVDENKVKIFYFTFVLDFIRNRKKYQLQKKLSCLYEILREILDIDLSTFRPVLPGLFAKERSFLNTLLTDFSSAKTLELNETMVYDVMLKLVIFTKDAAVDKVFENFKGKFIETVFNRKGDLYSKSTLFIQRYFTMNTESSNSLKKSIIDEVLSVLETFRINDNKTMRTLGLIELLFSYFNTETRNTIHSLINTVLVSKANKQIKLKTLTVLEKLATEFVFDLELTEKSLSALCDLREESLFLMLDSQFIKNFLRTYLQLLLNLNTLSTQRAQNHAPNLLSLSLDILFEVNNLEEDKKETDENETKQRNVYRLKRDITHIVCLLLDNTMVSSIMTNNSNDAFSLEDMLASLNFKQNVASNNKRSPISRFMALLLYTINSNFTQNFKFIDRIMRSFIRKLSEMDAFNTYTNVVQSFVCLLYNRLKETIDYEGREELMSLLLSKAAFLFTDLTENMSKSLENEEFTYILLLIQKYCSELDFSHIGGIIFDLAKQLIIGMSNEENSLIILQLIKSLGKFKRFNVDNLNQYEYVVSSSAAIVFNESFSNEIRKPFYDILQNFLVCCVENKLKLPAQFFEYLVNCCKNDMLFATVCKNILSKNDALLTFNENLLKLLVVLLPDEYIQPMLINNINSIIGKVKSIKDIPAETKIIVMAVEVVDNVHQRINLFEGVMRLIDTITTNVYNSSMSIKLMTSLSKNVNTEFFKRINEQFAHTLSVSQKKKDPNSVKTSLNFIKSAVANFEDTGVRGMNSSSFIEEYLDFVFANFKNRNTKTRLIVREIIDNEFNKFSTIKEDNRLLAIILSGLATKESKANFIEVLNFVVKKRYSNIKDSLKKNVFEILLLMIIEKNKSVLGVLLKLLKTLCRKSSVELLESYLEHIFQSFKEHNGELISVYREKIKKIFKILIKRFVS